MKKAFCIIIAIFMLLPVISALPAAAENDVYNWYCVHKAGNLQPRCDANMEFIEKYNGYYIDKNHGDTASGKVVYLTFDAGYENGNVAKILDVLKAENVPGAFFILRQLLDANLDLVNRMIDEGHTVCNHTAKHKDMTKLRTKEDFNAELEALATLYKEKTGHNMSKYYRPPEGKFNEENMKFASELGYKTVFWSLAYADWDNNHQMSHEAAKNKIFANIHNGAVILLHPTSATNAAILGDVIRELKSQGYSFGTLDGLTAETTSANVPQKYIALTFDDGPHPKSTPKILDIAAKYKIKATFFEVGQNVKYYPEVSRRVLAEGHEIGNHTYTHPHLSKINIGCLSSEISDCEREIYNLLGYKTKLFRPPEGVLDSGIKTLTDDLDYKVVLWTVDTRDWAGNSSEKIVETVLNNVKNGSIILMHDYTTRSSHTVEALEKIIPKLLEDGYTFLTVGELLDRR